MANKKEVSRNQADQSLDSMLDAGNQTYLDAMYEQYLVDPGSVPQSWADYFAALPAVDGLQKETPHAQVRTFFRQHTTASSRPGPRSDKSRAQASEHARKQVKVLQLINAYRFLGHLRANINPLDRDNHENPSSRSSGERREVRELTLEYHGLSERDLDTVFNTGSLLAPVEMSLRLILAQVQKTYCGPIGAEYMHIPETEQKRWIQQRLESVRSDPEYTKSQRRNIYDRLTAAETLERYLHSRYVGQKRFSLEGAESLIPLLDGLIQDAGASGVREIVIGMAHRGRLNTLINILGKSPAMLFREFEGKIDTKDRTGDVKYHMGYSSDLNTPGGAVHVALAFNPSHLEIVGPVVEGSVRARQEHYSEAPGDQVLPVVIHGDASVAGQGVVMETLNMSQTRGFKTRGTVRIVVNNQIGFTTSTRRDARSTYYCTDVAKMVNAPIFHVNGDDPEAVVFITQIALDFRMQFHRDVVIDLVCYRRHGHNEADEPAATQPLMYQRIRALPTTRELYARAMIRDGVLTETKAEDVVRQSWARLETGDPVVPHLLESDNPKRPFPEDWHRFMGQDWDQPCDTRIDSQRFATLGAALAATPEDLHVHARVARIMEARREMASGKKPADWGFGEMLAYASLLTEGFAVRLSGQDSERGTFFHRHAVVHDQDNGVMFMSLRHLADDQAPITIVNSLLSEEAVLAFEYGYATTEPDTLTIWEAQFGDFANGAQVVIDQFISSGEQKWGRLSGLVMFLPHGFEGMGPEHSSARLERYLQLCAQHNMQVCVPTTPAQTFHMLRRQMMRSYRKPLIVMTPKSLLRHPKAVSDQSDFIDGGFQLVIDDSKPSDPASVERVLLCSGKLYYDLLEFRESDERTDVALIRIEQLYPFPREALRRVLTRYSQFKTLVWCQEEPRNQGAWFTIQHYLREVVDDSIKISLASRPASAAPAVGSIKVHQQEQRQVVLSAFG